MYLYNKDKKAFYQFLDIHATDPDIKSIPYYYGVYICKNQISLTTFYRWYKEWLEGEKK